MKLTIPHLIIVMFIFFTANFSSVLPCTTFVLRSSNHLLFCRNLDWYTGSGILITNQKNIEKTACIDSAQNPVKWISKYGSITFNQVGRDLPFGGMNETGLVVEHMSLSNTSYPPEDERPAIQACQWIQFQLDNYSTINEVINSDKILRIVDANSNFHFLVCERSGKAASIEFLNGKMICHSGDDLPVEALANSTYEESLSCYKKITEPGDNVSLNNFFKAAQMVNNFEFANIESDIEYAFKTLSMVSQGVFTKWSIVYDITNMKVYFKIFETPKVAGKQIIFLNVPGTAKVKSVDIRGFDFSCSNTSKVIDLDIDKEGSVNEFFTDYSTAINKEFIVKAFSFFRKMGVLVKISDDDLDKLSKYPETFKCAAKD
ncbi:MAG: linear amide C-N hydrolase [Ignavibacteriaceae bacterium]